MTRRHLLWIAAAALLLSGCATQGSGIGSSSDSVALTLSVPEGTGSLSNSVQMVLLLTGLAFLPTVLILMTGFVRIAVVLASLRTAIGVPMLPPNQVVIGLALLLSFFVMAPSLETMNESAVQPYLAGDMDMQQALTVGSQPLREFMFKQVGEKDLALFVYLSGGSRPQSMAGIPTYVLLPAFIISELKIAFQMVFIIYIPFLVIDIVVSSALMSMGMMMLPPTIISLPFKLLLFVMVDGWNLLVRNLVLSFLN
ncbi:MAG: flagellar type III secretion system pore protein FliP [Caldilineaceae bacterium]|nr:flagellar type III secretion system pore protein FliP [Caldilineaceae bacterium]HRJ41903.1 flagellar type III secretion system pore protein FliP [Caldilineaceae bacterium]